MTVPEPWAEELLKMVGAVLTATLGITGWAIKRQLNRIDAVEKDIADLKELGLHAKHLADILTRMENKFGDQFDSLQEQIGAIHSRIDQILLAQHNRKSGGV